MVNYIIDPGLLEQDVPSGTQLDFYNGKTFVSLVGFMFLDTRILGLRVPCHINFEEVNLRFYVNRQTSGKLHRGVSFLREIVPRNAIAFIANNFYGENYRVAKMQNELRKENSLQKVTYQWKLNGKWNQLSCLADENTSPLIDGSEEEFIAEHYWGFTKNSESRTTAYEVYHPKWELSTIRNYTVDCDFKACFGERFEHLQYQRPSSVFLAKGSPVKIFYKQAINLT